jgi:hypothetical protein
MGEGNTVRMRSPLISLPCVVAVGLISQQRASDTAEIRTPGIWPSHAHAHQVEKILSHLFYKHVITRTHIKSKKI